MPTSMVKREENLRDGWRAEIDSHGEKTFYHNYMSGEKSYEKPLKPFLNLNRGDPILSSREKQQVGLVDGGVSTNPNEMPFSWIDTNRIAIEFEKEGLLSGENAVDQFSTAGGIVPSRKFLLEDNSLTSCCVKREESLQDGWRAEVEYGTRRTYYYNHLTGEATWEKPLKSNVHLTSDLPILAEEEKQETTLKDAQATHPIPQLFSWIDPMRFALSLGKDIERDNALSKDEFSTPGAIMPSRRFNLDVKTSCCVKAEENLMDGWRAEVEYDTKRVYYFNQFTGETTWDKPEKLRRTGSNPIFSQQEPVLASFKDVKATHPIPESYSKIEVTRLETMVEDASGQNMVGMNGSAPVPPEPEEKKKKGKETKEESKASDAAAELSSTLVL